MKKLLVVWLGKYKRASLISYKIVYFFNYYQITLKNLNNIFETNSIDIYFFVCEIYTNHLKLNS